MKDQVSILGVPVHNVTSAQAVEAIDRFVASRTPHKIIVANAAKLVKARKDAELKQALLTSHLVTADGISIVFAARVYGVRLVDRVTGSEHLLPMGCRLAAEKGYSVFFFGAAPGVAARCAEIMSARYPGLKVAGTYSPAYNILVSEEETRNSIQKIRAAAPDILFVALGTPKQEKWISRNLDKLAVPVCVGVGATFDFIAGSSKHPPDWVHGVGLAWLYRLMHEPRRLWRRNLESVVFVWLVLQERLSGCRL